MSIDRQHDAATLALSFEQVRQLLEGDADLTRRGAFFDAHFQVGVGSIPFDVKVESGRIVFLERGPFVMRSWTFAVRGTCEAWARFWEPMPEPGWHDLFALTKKGCMLLEGDLQPMMANLQYLKDLLVLPRRLKGEL